MVTERLAQLLRIGALALFSCVLASCGSGDGKSSVDVSDEDLAASRMQLVFADYFGDTPATSSRGAMQQRTLKDSAYWYSHVIGANGIPEDRPRILHKAVG